MLLAACLARGAAGVAGSPGDPKTGVESASRRKAGRQQYGVQLAVS